MGRYWQAVRKCIELPVIDRDARDDSGRYPIATLEIPRDEVVSTR
jgi:hypothetical protein